ncbi:mycofactocin-coupled SDR family oxidoreductase [Pseudonocardia dioxanivorans]|jgi:(+)-trans-carveol dehydrogenase|uniref:mycofactocin-coupled SDR family oxidoreductase n=1 Tax=Pseudonocardia dioxanivorans TaxID=240495 RepID=UPI000CD2E2C7|nr:mycofactocin-coupled SDR family oxidoreductase [Pseudonocardia dioxanivorans]
MSGGRLAGRVALVTGAARGQGRSHATALAAAGADVVAIDVCAPIATVEYPLATPDDLATTAKEVEALGRRAVTAEVDVRDGPALTRAIDAAVDELGRLDIVCANAGVVSLAPADELTDEAWDTVLAVNLGGVFKTARAAIPHLRAGGRGGSMILTSSAAAVVSMANNAHYVASKHGVVGLMKVLARELAPHRIRVNAVLPTGVNTPMILNEHVYARFLPDRDPATVTPAEVAPVFQSLNLLPVPWVESGDVSNAVVWLASDEARYVTGVQLPVDAGYTMP